MNLKGENATGPPPSAGPGIHRTDASYSWDISVAVHQDMNKQTFSERLAHYVCPKNHSFTHQCREINNKNRHNEDR